MTRCEKCGSYYVVHGQCQSCDEQPVERGLARRTDPETSHAAASAIDASGLQAVAYEAIIASGERGLINSELVVVTGLDWNTVTPRVRPLVNKGLVYADGTRPGPSGKKQTVWKATALGRKTVEQK